MTEKIILAVALGLMGMLFFLFRYIISNAKKEIAGDTEKEIGHIKEDVDKMEERLEKDEGEYLKTTAHENLCRIATLELKAHFSEELTGLKDAIFKELRTTQELIKNGNGAR